MWSNTVISLRHAGLVAVLFVLAVSMLGAQESDPFSRLSSAHIFGTGTSVEAAADLQIFEASGQTTRGIELYLQREGSLRTRMLAQVVSPAFLRNLKLLTITEGANSTTWMKTSQGTRRLGSGGGDQAVFSSHFRAGDFENLNREDYRFAFVPDMRSAPSNTAIEAEDFRNESLRRVYEIDSATGSFVRIRYFDDSELVREYQVLEFGSFDGATVPARARMDDYRAGGHTILVVQEYDADARIPARMFNPASL